MSGSLLRTKDETGGGSPVYKVTIDYAPREVKAGEAVRIFGKVTMDGKPVQGAEVDIYINDTYNGKTYTKKDGSYQFIFTFDRPGQYRVYVIAKIPISKALPRRKVSVWTIAGVVAAAVAGTAAVFAGMKKRGGKR